MNVAARCCGVVMYDVIGGLQADTHWVHRHRSLGGTVAGRGEACGWVDAAADSVAAAARSMIVKRKGRG